MEEILLNCIHSQRDLILNVRKFRILIVKGGAKLKLKLILSGYLTPTQNIQFFIVL